MMGYDHGSMMGGMWFFSILFWVLIIVGVVFLTQWFLQRKQNADGSEITSFSENRESALDILQKRYAKGEIDQETFEQMKKHIDS